MAIDLSNLIILILCIYIDTQGQFKVFFNVYYVLDNLFCCFRKANRPVVPAV